jgi:putative acetyltransferase
MHLLLRPEVPGDAPGVRQLLLAAFGGRAEAELVEQLRGGPAWLPDLALVAVAGTPRDLLVVGYCLFTRAEVLPAPPPAEPAPLLALGPLAVLPAYRHGGIGGLLVRAGLERAEASGAAGTVVLGSPAFYPRFGFRPAAEYGLRPQWRVPSAVFMALPLRPRCFSRLRGTVRYAPAFARVSPSPPAPLLAGPRTFPGDP